MLPAPSPEDLPPLLRNVLKTQLQGREARGLQQAEEREGGHKMRGGRKTAKGTQMKGETFRQSAKNTNVRLRDKKQQHTSSHSKAECRMQIEMEMEM